MFPRIISKLLILSLFLVINSTTAADISETFEPFMQCAKTIINEGLPELGIPPFSEIYFPEIPPIIIEDYLLKGEYILDDLSITGISDFDLEKADLNLSDFKLNFNFSMHGIHISTGYDFDGRILDLANLKGAGDLKISLSVDLFGDIKLSDKTRLSAETGLAVRPTIKIPGLTVGERMSELIGRQLELVVVNVVKEEKVQKTIHDIVNLVVYIITSGSLKIPEEIIEAIMNKCDLEVDSLRLYETINKLKNQRIDL